MSELTVMYDSRVGSYVWRYENCEKHEKEMLDILAKLYDEELKRLAKAKTKHCETVSDLIKIFCKIPPELLLDVVEVTDAGILGIAGFPEIKYTGSTLKITYYTRMGGMHTVCDMVNDWLNCTRKKDSYSVLARKEYENNLKKTSSFIVMQP